MVLKGRKLRPLPLSLFWTRGEGASAYGQFDENDF